MLFGGAPQEGLTPHHLKKAKLMFFYCRYPSSNVLKTYFPDVKVSRPIHAHLAERDMLNWAQKFFDKSYLVKVARRSETSKWFLVWWNFGGGA